MRATSIMFHGNARNISGFLFSKPIMPDSGEAHADASSGEDIPASPPISPPGVLVEPPLRHCIRWQHEYPGWLPISFFIALGDDEALGSRRGWRR
jgi:hypothetical protein